MKVINNVIDVYDGNAPLAVAIGNFDGVHIGHRAIFDKLKEEADKLHLKTAILTFNPHPLRYFNKGLELINSMQKRRSIFDELGIEYLLNISFDKAFAKVSADRFFRDIVIDKLNAKVVVVGKNFRFGADKSGDINLMSRIANEEGIKTIFVDNIVDKKGEVISSSLIRKLIKDGSIEDANRLLNRNFSFFGKVIHGDGKGKSFGFPTINLDVYSDIIPKDGVYATMVELRDRCSVGMTYIGLRPTINDKKVRRIETNIFDFNEDIYGDVIEIKFAKYLRGDMKFESISELKNQIGIDMTRALDFFGKI